MDEMEEEAFLQMETEMQKVNLSNDPKEAQTSAFEPKELGLLQTIQDIKNPEISRFHLFSPYLTEKQDFMFQRALKANSHKIVFASFESPNLDHLSLLSAENLKYLKINVIYNTVLLRSLVKSFSTNLQNLVGLSIGVSLECSPYSLLLDGIKGLSNLLFLRLTGEFDERDAERIGNILRSNRNLVHLGLHNVSSEPCTIYTLLLAVADHCCLRTLDLKVTATNDEILTELAECLANNHSLSELILEDTHTGLADSKLGAVLKKSRFIQSLQITPDFASRSLYEHSFIIDCMQSEDDLIVQFCRQNMKRLLVHDLQCQSAIKLASNLKVFYPWISSLLLSKIARPAFSFFRDFEFEVVGRVLFSSRAVSITSPFPFNATEYLRRCYTMATPIDYDFIKISTELHSTNAPEYFSHRLLKRREYLFDTKREIPYF